MAVRSTKLPKTIVMAGALAAFGCAPPGEEGITTENTEGSAASFLDSNGLNVNGLNVNGLNVNGLNVNGLNVNGLNVNGLNVNGAFVNWFNNADGGDLALHAQTMKYVVGCALRSDQKTGFTDKNGTVYSWSGALALATGWYSSAPTPDEKQWVSACLMAHVNTGVNGGPPKNIQISVRGNHPGLATTTLETSGVAMTEGVFFGDLFASPNVMYSCAIGGSAFGNFYETLLRDWGRQCAVSAAPCGQFVKLDSCSAACTASDYRTSGYHYSSCSVGGKAYQAVNIYLPITTAVHNWTLSGSTAKFTSCVNCLDYAALDNLSLGAANGASTLAGVGAGTYVADIRYANGGTSTAYARFQVNSANVMNGSSNRWDFPPTGGKDVWGHRKITVNIPSAGTKIAILSAALGVAGPRVDAVSFWIP